MAIRSIVAGHEGRESILRWQRRAVFKPDERVRPRLPGSAGKAYASRSMTQAMKSASEIDAAARFSITEAVADSPSGGWPKVAPLRSTNSRMTSYPVRLLPSGSGW
jgi:hypothetical protein